MRGRGGLAVLLVLAGCVEVVQLDRGPFFREFDSELPSFAGTPGEAYPVFLVQGERTARGSLCHVITDYVVFYQPPPIHNPAPYSSGSDCRGGDAVASLLDGRLDVNRTRFQGDGPQGLILHGAVPTGTSKDSVCCSGWSEVAHGRSWTRIVGGQEVVVTRDGGTFRVAGNIVGTHDIPPGRVVEVETREEGGAAYVWRFENPGTWLRGRVRDPLDDWEPCVEPKYSTCRKSWHGTPPWWPSRPDPKPTEWFPIVRLNQSAHTLQGLTAALLGLPGWDAANLTRLSVTIRDARVDDLELEAEIRGRAVNVTRFEGIAPGPPYEDPMLRVRPHDYSRSEFAFAVRDSTAPPRPTVGPANATLATFQPLRFDTMLASAGVGGNVTVTVEDGPQYRYDVVQERVMRATGVPASYPQVWVYAQEPLEDAGWRLIRQPAAFDPTVPEVVLRSGEATPRQVTFHVAFPPPT